MGASGLEDLIQLVDRITRRYARGRDFLLAEHGSDDSETRGGCITHTHLNYLPRLGRLATVLDSDPNFPALDIHRLAQIVDIRAPYLLLATHRTARAFDASNAESQFLRRCLLTAMGREDWDWALFPKTELIQATVREWRNIGSL